MCKKSSCANATEGFSYLTEIVYPNSTEKFLIPLSRLVMTRKQNGATTAALQLMPELPREHLYLTVSDVTVLRPMMPSRCSEINIRINHLAVESLSPLSQTRAVLSVTIENKGKVLACQKVHFIARK